MPTPTTTISTAAAAALASFLLCRSPPSAAPTSPPPLPSNASSRPGVVLAVRSLASRRLVSCQVALSSNLSSGIEMEEHLAAAMVGQRVRVKVPLKVYHVMKAPDLDLDGLEGIIKQYVGVCKGKRISANLPFKVEFEINVEGQVRPVKFFAHLKEDEFEHITASKLGMEKRDKVVQEFHDGGGVHSSFHPTFDVKE
ncbi:ferredoxin-thioredoxin reductase, variable [Musa troglodytarum]|uniref:Ferredoxin-thioredoxin reductase, variable n=1 Tax=Musa troglodytarum TaxID=320322 RepID=A0A9E7JVN7_9LILI|nr:ferredoxin-thioredoxin reductase, variable [Musa troglodytarum]